MNSTWFRCAEVCGGVAAHRIWSVSNTFLISRPMSQAQAVGDTKGSASCLAFLAKPQAVKKDLRPLHDASIMKDGPGRHLLESE